MIFGKIGAIEIIAMVFALLATQSHGFFQGAFAGAAVVHYVIAALKQWDED